MIADVNTCGSWQEVHLAILSQYYPPEVGAPQTRLSELAAHFVQAGHQVTVLTAQPNYPTGRVFPGYEAPFRRETRDGVTLLRSLIYPCQSTQLWKRLANYFSFAVSSAVVGSACLTSPDYLLVESPPLFLGPTGVYLARLTGARLIFNVSDLWPESAVQLGVIARGGWSHRVSAGLEAYCYRQAWLVTGQSLEILADIEARFPSAKTYHLSNGADTAAFHPDRQTAAARARLTAPGDGCVAFYAGLHGLAQGLDQVLAAAGGIGSDGGLQFVFAGDGPMKKSLMAQAESEKLEHVTFLDPQPKESMPALVASADISLVTLRTYIPGAVPSKVYEAMASARPVVLVAEGEAAGIVSSAEAGIVVRPGRVDELIDALLKLRRSPELRARLGANGRRAAQRLYDRGLIAGRFLEHLRKEQGA